MPETPKATAYSVAAAQAEVEARSWLELGHLRELVAAADRAGVADTAMVALAGLSKSVVHLNQWNAKKATVRSERYTQLPEEAV